MTITITVAAIIILFVLVGGATLTRVAGSSPAEARFTTAVLFAANIFFHVPGWALVEVVFPWLPVGVLIIGVASYSSQASWLLLPCLLWVYFAAYLNLEIVRLNGPFSNVD